MVEKYFTYEETSKTIPYLETELKPINSSIPFY